MRCDFYKKFNKLKKQNIMCLDFSINYNKIHNCSTLNFIILFKGIYIKDNIKNNFNVKCNMIINIKSDDVITIKSFNILSITCSNQNINDDINNKYCSNDINVLNCFSEEYNCDFEGDICYLLETILKKTTVNISNNILIFNMKLVQNNKNEYIDFLSLKYYGKNDKLKSNIFKNDKHMINKTEKIILSMISIIMLTCYYMYSNIMDKKSFQKIAVDKLKYYLLPN